MAGCAAQTFQGITQERFDCMAGKAKATGIAIDGNAGSATKDFITIRWQFDPVNQTLELQCTETVFIPCETIDAQLQALVAGCP